MMVAKSPYPVIIAGFVALFLTLRYMYHNNQETGASVQQLLPNIPEPNSLQDKNAQQQGLQHMDEIQDLDLHDIGEFYRYVETPTHTCNNLKVIGGMLHNYKGYPVIDGDKDVCLDATVLDRRPGKCLVYSFGIRNEWSFDDSMAWYGCKVHAFDPFMNMKSHNRSTKISFYDIGIGNEDGFSKIGKRICKVKRFASIMALLGHEKDVMIDYLKIDVEGAEIPFLEDVLLNNPKLLQRIKQIGMEIHPKVYNKSKMNSFKKHYKLLKQLESHGFRLVTSKGNPYPFSPYYLSDVGRKVHKYYDILWVRWPNTQKMDYRRY